MSALRARRVALDGLAPDVRDALRRAGARAGVVHATSELVVVGLGAARTVRLDAGLAGDDAPEAVAHALDGVALQGDDGPGGTGVVAAGALPFDPDEPGTLVVPALLCAWEPAGGGAWATATGDGARDPAELVSRAASIVADVAPVPAVRAVVEEPDAAVFEAAVATCVGRLRGGAATKVVLARAVRGESAGELDPAALAEALHRLDPSCDLYAVPDGAGRFVGASPELIVATADGAVTAHPLAGTVAFGDGDDDARAEWLLRSEKNRAEHAVVVEDVVARLTPLCDALHAAAAPSVVRLSTNARLGTWVDGKLLGPRDAATALRALAALHPTAAVGGVPREVALATIAELEARPRGLWAGPVGWVDRDGTSTWTLALRGIRVEGARFGAFGGAGIVAASDPADEREETGEKLRSVLRVLGA